MTADMGGAGGRSGFGYSSKDGDWRSPLQGEDSMIVSGGEVLEGDGGGSAQRRARQRPLTSSVLRWLRRLVGRIVRAVRGR